MQKPVKTVGGILSGIWWIYVLIMSPSILFSGGIEEFFIGILAVIVLLLVPFIFMRD